RAHSVNAAARTRHQGGPYAVLSQNFHHAIDCVPFADSARIHFHTGTIETHRPGIRVQPDVPVAHLGERRRHFRFVGQVAAPFIEAPNLHQRSHRDIERTFALPAVFDT